MVTIDNLDDVFDYHAPTPTQQIDYAAIRQAAKHFAQTIINHTRQGADRHAAIRLVREAMMTANASVATEGIV